MTGTSRGRSPPAAIRVVIGDDHELIRLSLAAVLAADGMSVVASCATGEETIAAAARHRPDVVVMDLSMPDSDGVDVVRRILGFTPSTTVVIVTALARRPETDAALAAGARAVVLKDDGSDEVIAVIRGLHHDAAPPPSTPPQHHPTDGQDGHFHDSSD